MRQVQVCLQQMLLCKHPPESVWQFLNDQGVLQWCRRCGAVRLLKGQLPSSWTRSDAVNNIDGAFIEKALNSNEH